MTPKTFYDKRNDRFSGLLGILIFTFTTTLLLIFAKEAKDSIIFGIKLSALSIIPAIFPFFILSDLLLSSYDKTDGFLGRILKKTFNISSAALPILIIGMLCGFPLGVRCAAELYKEKSISKKECEILSGFANNPSLAFVVSGVGIGMMGSIKLGLILYFSVISASLICGFLFKPKDFKTEKSVKNTRQTFNLSLSIKNAIYSSISVSAYIIFFSMLLGLLSAILKNEIFITFISPIFEVGNATKLLSSNTSISGVFTFPLIAFSLGFSGLSVFMQAVSFLPPEISRTKLLIIKITEGLFSALISLLMSMIINT